MGLGGGWIDQPSVNRHDPDPPGSMVVVNLEPSSWYMERSGMATSTRRVAAGLWPAGVPEGERAVLVRRLYEAENRDRTDPSGSQDMIGLLYPGISRLDYRSEFEGGVFPERVETCVDPDVVAWLERVVHVLPVAPRPAGYDPLVGRRTDPEWVARLGRSGRASWDAVVSRDCAALGAAVNECMKCWDALFPASFDHPALTVDWREIVAAYQARYDGAMVSASGGGYLFVISERPVPGSFAPTVRTDHG